MWLKNDLSVPGIAPEQTTLDEKYVVKIAGPDTGSFPIAHPKSADVFIGYVHNSGQKRTGKSFPNVWTEVLQENHNKMHLDEMFRAVTDITVNEYRRVPRYLKDEQDYTAIPEKISTLTKLLYFTGKVQKVCSV